MKIVGRKQKILSNTFSQNSCPSRDNDKKYEGVKEAEERVDDLRNHTPLNAIYMPDD